MRGPCRRQFSVNYPVRFSMAKVLYTQFSSVTNTLLQFKGQAPLFQKKKCINRHSTWHMWECYLQRCIFIRRIRVYTLAGEQILYKVTLTLAIQLQKARHRPHRQKKGVGRCRQTKTHAVVSEPVIEQLFCDSRSVVSQDERAQFMGKIPREVHKASCHCSTSTMANV